MSKKYRKKNASVTVTDGLVNVVANLGTGRDKAAHTQYIFTPMSQDALVSAYRSSWLASAIVDYPVEDATRKWRSWRAELEQITKIERIESVLGLKSKVQEALVAARLYGGAAIYINTPNADQSTELSINEEIKSLVVLTQYDLNAEEVVRDINSKYFRKPEHYRLSTIAGNEVRIHASRLVIFAGSRIPGDQCYTAWGDSVLQSTIETVKQVDSTMANIASLVFEAKVDVFKFAGYADMLSQNEDGKVVNRLTLQAAMKGINGAVVIDKEDEYDQKSASFAGLPDVAKTFLELVAAASRIPYTRLVGRSATGLSGNGDGDERTYYDRIADIQSDEITPALRLLDDCIIRQALGSVPADIYYEWTPLRQNTDAENAEIFGKIATAARTLAGAQAGAIIPLDALSESLVNALTEAGSLPGLDQAVSKFGSLNEQNSFVGENDL